MLCNDTHSLRCNLVQFLDRAFSSRPFSVQYSGEELPNFLRTRGKGSRPDCQSLSRGRACQKIIREPHTQWSRRWFRV